MSPLRDVAATTGIGAGPLAAAFVAAPPDLLVIFGQRKYTAPPSRRRTDMDSQTHRRRECFGFPAGALLVRPGVTGADGTAIWVSKGSSRRVAGLSGIGFLARSLSEGRICLRAAASLELVREPTRLLLGLVFHYLKFSARSEVSQACLTPNLVRQLGACWSKSLTEVACEGTRPPSVK